jgi:hypothetical protein
MRERETQCKEEGMKANIFVSGEHAKARAVRQWRWTIGNKQIYVNNDWSGEGVHGNEKDC